MLSDKNTQEIKYWIDSLVDIGCKSIINRDSSSAKNSIKAIQEIAEKYIQKKQSIICNDDAIINLIYESLSRLNYVALSATDEVSLIDIQKVYLGITSLTFSYTPLFWLIKTINEAQARQLDNVIYQATNLIIKEIESKFSKEIVNDSIYEKIIDFYIEVINYFLNRKSLLTNSVIDKVIRINTYLVSICYKNSVLIISYTLEKIRPFIGIAILYEKIDGGLFNLVESLYPSIYSILEVAKRIGPTTQQETQHERIEPYSYFLNISHEISNEFLKQREIDFKNSVLLIKLTQSIKDIFKLFYDLLDNPIIGFSQNKATEEIKKYIWFLEGVFIKNKKYVKNSYDLLSYAGIKFIFLNNNNQDIVICCVDAIIAVAKSYSISKNIYDIKKISNALSYVWLIRIAAEKNNLTDIKIEIDKKIDDFIGSFEQSLKNDLQKFLSVEKNDIYRALDENDHPYIIYMDTAQDLLKQHIKSYS